MPVVAKKAEKARFILVGATATLIDFGLLFALQTSARLPVLPSNILSTFAAFCFSFVANKKYTFKSENSQLLREMLLFTVVTLFGLWVLQSIVISLVLPVANTVIVSSSAALLVAKLLATVVSTVWNYVLYSRLVFVRK